MVYNQNKPIYHKKMNGPSVSGQKEDQNLQLDIEFKSEFKN